MREINICSASITVQRIAFLNRGFITTCLDMEMHICLKPVQLVVHGAMRLLRRAGGEL